MNFFFYFFALCAIAKASVVPGPAALIADSALHSNQYHSQDAVGQYSYGYSDPHSAKSEVRSADGQTVGSYSYVDPAGKLQTVHYRYL
ncbi:hypothetical protein ABEB36_002826 [Hypothenemus hampei]|uniref:Uncharacterized protein n=1 Tax=Hypothenemus hampei TaxID=57062 RepID=A0ABD1F7S2_HYPHA